MRKLSNVELGAISRLIDGLDEKTRTQLFDDLKSCDVESTVPDGSVLMIAIPNYERPPYHGQHPYPVEGVVSDKDGAQVEVILYADRNDRILEIELLKWGDAPLVEPDWGSLSVVY